MMKPIRVTPRHRAAAEETLAFVGLALFFASLLVVWVATP